MLTKKQNKILCMIVEYFEGNNIQYRITGGLAAKVYGSKRELADIDFDIKGDYLDILRKHFKNYIVFGPDRYIDSEGDAQYQSGVNKSHAISDTFKNNNPTTRVGLVASYTSDTGNKVSFHYGKEQVKLNYQHRF